ncbi:T9SS type A sorting domain-containing protein [Bacteroidales bacterium OttesenSCG-928-B11]|nr:T9SS type A sorting domain-containing protein [Bacteroidales bacterium OttesenSCG-928-E04]MDL2311368.1 T9SS type A sorting domain-containing protein [Bacteroidales bacterium OttesenSCG-928-B11]MDL2326018.1 T9SS type A sorting domain-containing protein [Bacteroidales bacterium OttesenSCG-928-A14]
MKTKTMIFAWIILSAFSAVAQEKVESPTKSTEPATIIFDVNNISALFCINEGVTSDEESGAHFFVPKNSTKSTMYYSDFWIGGRDQNQQRKIASTLLRTFGSNFTPGPIFRYIADEPFDPDAWEEVETAQDEKWNRFYIVEKKEIDDFLTSGGTQIANSILEWPAHGDVSIDQPYHLAPFFDKNGDGVYNPHHGDHPLIRGDRAAFFIINGTNHCHLDADFGCFEVDIHGMIYGFDAPQDEVLNNTIFLNYKIVNRTGMDITDTYLSLGTSFNIGLPSDDYIGCDVQRNAYFGYNASAVDGNGQAAAYGNNPPIQAVVILGGPTINDERLGMTGFLSYTNDTGVTGYPSTTFDFYNISKGIWRDNTRMRYGGGGHVNCGANGPECDYMYPGLTDPDNIGTDGVDPNPLQYSADGWTEGGIGNAPGSRSGVGNVGPFTLLTDQTVELDFAYLTVFPKDSVTRFDQLGIFIDSLTQSFLTGKTPYGQDYVTLNMPDNPKQPTPAEILLFPNPTSEIITIQLKDNNQQMGIIELYNIFGMKILTDNVSGNEHQISMKNLASGIYFCRIYSHTKQELGTYKIVKK